MSTAIEIGEAQEKLKDILSALGPDDEVILLDNNRPIAKLIPTRSARPTFGGCKGLLTIVKEDDEHLEDFKDYIP